MQILIYLYLYLPTPTPPPPQPTWDITVPGGDDMIKGGVVQFVGYWNQINTGGYMTTIQALVLMGIVFIGLAFLFRMFQGSGE